MPQVKVPAPYRGTTLGAKRVEVEGATVRECILAVAERFPGFADQVFDAGGDVHRFVKLFINGDELDRTRADAAVEATDEVEVLAAVHGG